MQCKPTQVPESVDIPALRERYLHERNKRLRSDGQAQYERPVGGAVADYSVDPHTSRQDRDAVIEELDVVILGAGFGGVLAGYHLANAGVTNFRNIDQAGDFGGVWYWNRYPGIQCDNDAYCYLPLLEVMGFMPSKKFSDGWEIQAYIRLIAERTGFADNALFHTQINDMRWDDAAQRWHVRTDRGDELHARFVVMACGVLNMPKLPSIEGINSYKGKIFHTARWDYEYTGGSYQNPQLNKLTDKRVAIVGTGATAIQAIPYLAKHAKQLYVVQRTPSSVDERSNPPTDPTWAESLPSGWQAERQANFHRAAMESFLPGESDLICDIWTELNRNLSALFEAEGWPQSPEEYMERREQMDYRVMERIRQRVEGLVDDPKTAEALKPYYRYLCKRPLSNNEYYPVFNQPNVELIDVSDTQGLQKLTETGFVANGKEYEVDCVIFASGFEVTSSIERRWGIDVIEGRNGQSIYEHWKDGPLTFQGTMSHGFPNQFYIGYIQGAVNASVTLQFGEQGRHAAYIISEVLKRGATVAEPTAEAQNAYVDEFEEKLIDVSEFQSLCPPSYFNNEGESDTKWALFRSWGEGWDAFQDRMTIWRNDGNLSGLNIE